MEKCIPCNPWAGKIFLIFFLSISLCIRRLSEEVNRFSLNPAFLRKKTNFKLSLSIGLKN